MAASGAVVAAGAAPQRSPLRGPFGYAMTVDVEEWYHTCWVPAYVRPAQRPPLTEELDHLLPDILELFASCDRTATFFVLGEVATRLPERIREVAAAGHEVACHGALHLRIDDYPPGAFRQATAECKAQLEDLVGRPVRGYRAPEWSLRRWTHPRLETVAAMGFGYDSSLTPCLGSGHSSNPHYGERLRWKASGKELIELPPLTFAGALRLPACGWTGRLSRMGRLVAAARRHHRRGGLPVMTTHPWELSGAPTPGRLRGMARFLHETGRQGYRPRFERLLRALPWTSVAEALAGSEADLAADAAEGPSEQEVG